MTVLAIDQGTSATKAVVIDDSGAIVALAEVALEVIATADGGVEIDPRRMWESVVEASRNALRASGNPRLDAIGLANQGETVMAWDRANGEPVGPAIVWQDRRSASVCDALAGSGDRLSYLTGLQLDPYFVAPKMRWLRDLVDGSLSITTTDTWLLHQLCGAFVTDVATAGRSLLLDLETTNWSDEACKIFGIDSAELPAVVGNADVLGYCTLFGGSVPVSGACVDQQAALFAERCHTAGEAKCTYGTGAFLLASTGSVPTRSTNGLVGCPAWSIRGARSWCLDGQVYTVGAAVTWLIDMGIIAEPNDLDRLGATVADAGGVTFVPALAGLAAPFWKPSAKAAFTGMSLSTQRGHLVRAALEGVAAQVTLLAHAAGADLGAPLTRLRVDGGLTRSALLLQTQADLLQCPVEVFPSPHATALGVGAFAGLGIGQPHSAPRDTDVVEVHPSISLDAAMSRLAAWQRVAAATCDL